MATTHTRRLTRGALAAGAVLLFPLAGCSGDEANTGTSVLEDTGAAASTASSAAGAVGEAVDCSGTSCSATLSPDTQSVEILGTSVSFGGVQDGEATFSVGNQEVSCTEGQSVGAGPLTVECTTVSDDSVTFTASLG
ncbi:hypothetical protein SAMN04515665_10922 [Blastococcus sp. DSM 46786]|uniref:hypothetical protein n=1 Tax=Blastococcus sp. DSM 46786 TaxID=1798227 RepID=UPI0008D53D34|nr:hypothetical protein [Blastococcus sp. DSM 46786]SEL16160.1 hypothetical protein SAMN04515665_10922 [Blastococcus sp. DSM 46786]